ncbi:glycosyltransferase [Niastella sp. OAS944]|uniref:glycosyltransferase n=1 Tax=Niastella sp. OAS944 TaxID=2664089 RepID=UPI00349B3B3C|nr:cellulose synthase/poly-beta-1,6-N-acetylglucosamine synthase-like glycosyltransferase [Chitinophagaceae bacterium OAS944]
MLQYLNNCETKLTWIGDAPGKTKKNALLIPQYNESGNGNFEARLNYFKKIADENRGLLDVIIIDDGSTDESVSKLNDFLNHNPGAFHIASVFPNANKVGALYLTTLAISHEFVILSDFDTDIIGVNKLVNSPILEKDTSLMGCYFRMLPFEGSGKVFQYQQLEYSLARSLYKFHEKEKSIRVMPGAGSYYKREILISIYEQHSGLRSGEDREATLIGLKLGYKTVYEDNILALTRPPLSLKALIKQRVRWNLGYLETFNKEKKYYFEQIKQFSRLGIMTLMDIGLALLIVSFPFLVLLVSLTNVFYVMILFLLLYVVNVSWCYNLIFLSPLESTEFKRKRTQSILIYPLFKILVDYFSWMGAIIVFIKKNKAVNNSTIQFIKKQEAA